MGAFDGAGKVTFTPIRYGSTKQQGLQQLNSGVRSAPDDVLGGRLAEEGENGERTVGDLLETALRRSREDDDKPTVYDPTVAGTGGEKKSGSLVDVIIGDERAE